MILTLDVENFRGITGSYSFSKRNLLRGANGARKSSIKEAIAFAFTGTDSSGNRAPVHLISWGEDSCKVLVKTDKALISRSLTAKKSGTLKLVRGEVATTLTQTQFEQMLGATGDLFLSVFTPGYFWTMPLSRQQAVLSEVAPVFDVAAFLNSQLQTPLTEMELVKFKFSEKRPDIVASAIANERRDIQRQLDVNAGRSRPTEKVSIVNVKEPVRPDAEIALLSSMEALKRSWSDYHSKLSAYNSVKQTCDATTQVNENRRTRRAELQGELKAEGGFATGPTTPFLKEKQEQLTSLRSSFQSNPQPPQLANSVDSPNCPTCGQVVGLKHKEKVKAENNKRLAEYEVVSNEVIAHNGSIQAQINVLIREEEEHREWNRKIEESNNQVKQRKTRLEGELSGLTDVPVPVLPAVPEPPTQEYSEQHVGELRGAVERYNVSLSEYRFAQQVLMEQEAARADIERNNEPLLTSRDRLASLEEAVKAIPAAKLKFQTSAFLIPGFTFVQDDLSGVSLVRDHDKCPYSLLSTGEAINVNILFSRRLNSLMRRPVGVMFVDNTDLVDVLVKELYELQVFEAYVVEGQDSLTVEALN